MTTSNKMATTKIMSTAARRPTKARYCTSTVGSNAMVMDTTIRFSYRMETNREDLTDNEREGALALLRDDILQSLVNNHCPLSNEREGGDIKNKGSNEGTRRQYGGSRRHLELEVLSLHSSSAQPVDTITTSGNDDEQCPLTTSDSESCEVFSNDLNLLLDAANMQEGGSPEELKASVEATIRDSMEDGFYTALVNHKLAEGGSDFVITAFTYVGDQHEKVEEVPEPTPAEPTTDAPVLEIDTHEPLLDLPRPGTNTIEEEESEPVNVATDAPEAIAENPTSLVLDPTAANQNTANGLVNNSNNGVSSSGGLSSDNTTTFALAIAFGIFSLVLGLLLWMTCRKQKNMAISADSKGAPEKEDSSVKSSQSDTMVTDNESLTLMTTAGDESLTYGPEELASDEDEDTLGSLASKSKTSSDDQDSEESASATFMTGMESSKMTMESSYLMSSLPPPLAPSNTIMKVLKCESPPAAPTCAPCMVPGTNESFTSGRCESAACKPCSSTAFANNNMDINDTQYLCPNFKLPGTENKKEVDNSNDVCIRVFEEDFKRPKATTEDDAESRVMIPPSQVTQARDGPKITLAVDPSFGYNSLLASGSETSSVAETAAGNRPEQGSMANISKAGSMGSSNVYMQRSLRPAKTVEL